MSHFDVPSRDDRFSVVQPAMDWLRLAFWESIFSLSNGLLGTRGSFEEPMAGTPSRPMTFMAGLYNTLPKGLPELPVLPDWKSTHILLDGAPLDLRLGVLLKFTRWLDLRHGLLGREVIWRDARGRTTHLRFLRFLSMADVSLAVSRIELTPVDWSGPVEVEMGLPLPDPAAARRGHWRSVRLRAKPDGVASLSARSSQTRRPLAVAGACDGRIGGEVAAFTPIVEEAVCGQRLRFDAERGRTCVLDRFVTFLAGEAGDDPPRKRARTLAVAFADAGFASAFGRHAEACARMWERIDVEIDGPDADQRAIRYNLFQLATLRPPPDLSASIGPKGLSGTHYLGHIFWDTEIYMLPFFTLTDPDGARALLQYRYDTLGGARRKARDSGYRGARYAWESADTGEETCPRWIPDHTGEKVRVWCGDLQDHITADVAWGVDQYVRASGDTDFLWDRGAEILFETARFWASRATPNAAGEYDIRDVMGPDEFHIHVDNDAYTNWLARWNLLAAADLYENDAFPADLRTALLARLKLGDEEPDTWRTIATRLRILIDASTGLIIQSEGFTDRPDLSPDILALERRCSLAEIIGPALCAEAQVLKQAEVVCLLHLFERSIPQDRRELNFDYYEPRTIHDSSLSVSMHALVAARLGRGEQAWSYFRRAAYLDLEDLAGNTADGLHTANLGGVWMALAYGFAGLTHEGDEVTVRPNLPAGWNGLRFSVTVRGRRYRIDCTRTGGRARRVEETATP